MHSPSVKALLFDLGGVVLEVDFGKVFGSLASLSTMTEKEIKARFTMDKHYQQHERGEIETSEYFEHLRQSFELTATDAEIADSWNAIFGLQMTASLDAIDRVRHNIPCYGFSNTNRCHQLHWEHHFPRISGTFEKLFVSSEIGLRKPEAEAFKFILGEMSSEPHEVLFFDDSQENLDGAQQLGIETVLVTGSESVVSALKGFMAS